jgi:hypothetical protein
MSKQRPPPLLSIADTCDVDARMARRHLFEAYMIGHGKTVSQIQKLHPGVELSFPRHEAETCLIDPEAAKRGLMWCIYEGDPYLTRIVLDTTHVSIFDPSAVPFLVPSPTAGGADSPCTPRALAEKMLDGSARRRRVLDVIDEEERIRKLGRITGATI